MSWPACFAAATVSPTEATSGSVNVDLRNGLVVGGGDVRAPRRVRDGRSVRPGRDDVAGGPRLVLALVGEQRAVVHVADGVQPVEPLRQHGVVDVDPVARGEADGVQADVLVRGVRPVATSTSSAVTVIRRRSRSDAAVPARCTRVVWVFEQHGDALLPQRRQRRSRRRTAPCPPSRPPREINVTVVPKPA